jgi:hypothetical protein
MVEKERIHDVASQKRRTEQPTWPYLAVGTAVRGDAALVA